MKQAELGLLRIPTRGMPSRVSNRAGGSVPKWVAGDLVTAVLAVLMVAALLSPAGSGVVELVRPDVSSDAGIGGATSQTVLPGEVPDGLTAEEWADIQAQVAAGQTGLADAAAAALTGPAPRLVVPSAGFDVVFPAEGPVVRSGDARVQFGLATVNDHPANLVAAERGADATIASVEYARGPVTEWYRSVDGGLEQGFTVAEPLVGDGLRFEIAISGAQAELTASGDAVLLYPTGGGTVLRYDKLIVIDAEGTQLPAAMSVQDGSIVLTVDDTDAVYPVVVDPTITEDETIVPPADRAFDEFGTSVAVDGDLAIVGIPGDDGEGHDAGAALVFDRSGGTWVQTQTLIAPDGERDADDRFGAAVAIAGTTLVVSAPGDDADGIDAGAVYVYDSGNGIGTEFLYASGVTPAGTGAGFGFGTSIDIATFLDQTVLLVGAPGAAGGAGQAIAFLSDGATPFALDATLSSGVADPGDAFGSAVAIADNPDVGFPPGSAPEFVAVVGAPLDAGAGIAGGSAELFSYCGQICLDGPPPYSWSSDGQLVPTNRPDNANFGAAVDIDFDSTGEPVAVAGAPTVIEADPVAGVGEGNVYWFDLVTSGTGTTVTDTGQLVNDPVADPFAWSDVIYDAFVRPVDVGFDVSFDGVSIWAGVPSADDGGETDVGIAIASTWNTVTRQFEAGSSVGGAGDGEPGDAVGRALSHDGANVVVALPGFDSFAPSGGIDAGAVWSVDGGAIGQQLESSRSLTATIEAGTSVAIDGNRMVVGAPFEDAGADRSGEVYTFVRTAPGSAWALEQTLAPPAPVADGFFGTNVDIAGSFLIVSQPGDNTAHVFEQAGVNWAPFLTPLFSPETDYATSVAIAPDGRAFVSTPLGERVDMFTPGAGVWSGATNFTSLNALSEFGAAIALDANLLVVGAPGATAGADFGGVEIFDIDTTALVHVQVGLDTVAQLGDAVAIDGTRVAAYAPGSDDLYVLDDEAGSWDSQVVPVAGLSAGPSNSYVAISGDYLALASPLTGSGTVDLFTYSGAAWSVTPTDDLVPTDIGAGDRLGYAVAIDGLTLAAGAPGYDISGGTGTNGGVVYTAELVPPGPCDNTWDGGGGDLLWSTAANWSTDAVPTSTEVACIPAGFSVEVDTAQTVGALQSEGDIELIANLTIAGGPTEPSSNTGDLTVNQNSVFDTAVDFDQGGVTTVDGGTVIASAGSTLTFTGPVNGSAAGGFAPSFGGTIVNVDTMELTSDTSLSGNFTNDGTLNFSEVGPTQVISGAGQITNNGTIETLAGGGVVEFQPDHIFVSSPTSFIDVAGKDLQLQSVVDEEGTVRIGAGRFISYADNVSVSNPDATYEFVITGPSSDTANYGRVLAADFSMGGTLNATIIGYTPVAGDSYVVATCGITCGTGLAASNTAPLEATVNANDITLALAGSLRPAGPPSVAVHGEFAAIGVPADDTVYVVERQNNGTWGSPQTFTGDPGSQFGASVALDSSYLAVGAPGTLDDTGEVHLYRRDAGGTFSPTPPQQVQGSDAEPGDRFGSSVALMTQHLVVGAPFTDGIGNNSIDSGAAYVYDIPGFSESVTFNGENANDEFGWAVAAGQLGNARSIFVGAPGESSIADGQGAVYHYRYDAGWGGSNQLIRASDGDLGHRFGTSLDAETADIVAVGAPFAAALVGQGYVYYSTFDGAVPVLEERILLPDAIAAPGDAYGESIAIAGDNVALGSPSPGAIALFSDNGNASDASGTSESIGVFTELTPETGVAGFGSAVALSGETLLVGLDPSTPTAAFTDAATFITYEGFDSPDLQLEPEDPTSGDAMGQTIALEGDTLVVGAPTGDDLGPNAGRVVVFRDTGTGWTQRQVLTLPSQVGFGRSVALAGENLVVGGRDAVAVFIRPSILGQFAPFGFARLLTDPDGSADGTTFGTSVAIDAANGDVYIGDPGDAEAFGANGGAVYANVTGTTLDKILPGAPVGDWGVDIGIDGDRLAVSGAGASGGEVWILERPDAATPFAGVPDTVIDAGGPIEALALSGDRVAVLTDAGPAEVFERVAAGDWGAGIELLPAEAAVGADFSAVAIDGDVIAVGEATDSTVFAERGAVYTFAHGGGTWPQVDRFTADIGDRFDQLGASVAVDGFAVAAGAPGEDNAAHNAGAAILFTTSAPEPTPANKIPGIAAGSEFGSSVDTWEDKLIVGAPEAGAAYIFDRAADGTWTLDVTLTGTVSSFGSAVSIAGTEDLNEYAAIVGNPADGEAAIYSWTDVDDWQLMETITGSQGEPGFGRAVALTQVGSTFRAGSYNAVVTSGDAATIGGAYVFAIGTAAGTAIEVDRVVGSTIDAASDNFGNAVAIDGSSFIVGAEADDESGTTAAGSATVFTAVDEQLDLWSEQGVLAQPSGQQTSGDRFGWSVDIDGDRAAIGAALDSAAGGGDAGSVTVFTRSAGLWDVGVRLEPAAATSTDRFGSSVAVDGDVVVGGARTDGGTGYAASFRFDGANWTEDAPRIEAADGAADERFGAALALSDSGDLVVGAPLDDIDANADIGSVYTFAVALEAAADQVLAPAGSSGDDARLAGGLNAVASDGGTIIVGAPDTDVGGQNSVGTAFVVENVGGTWQVTAELANPAPAAVDNYAIAVGISGDVAIVGDRSNGAHVWTRSGGVWTYDQLLVPATIPVSSGLATRLDFDGTTLAVGEKRSGTVGEVAVFERNPGDGTWAEQAVPAPSAPSTTPGFAIAVEGDLLLVGSEQSNANAGEAFVYERTGNTWTEIQALSVPAGEAGSLFGSSVAIDGERLLIGARSGTGKAFLFERVGGGAFVSTATLTPDSQDFPSNFGRSVSLDANLAVLGSDLDRVTGTRSGAVALFAFDGTAWTEFGELVPSDREATQSFGVNVSVDGLTVVAGSPRDNSSNGVDAGAVYVFDVVLPDPPVVDEPTLTLDLTTTIASVTASATGINVADLPPAAAAGYGGDESTVSGTPLGAIGTSAGGADDVELLGRTDLEDLNLDGAILDSILLSDVVVDGGWQLYLSGSAFDGVPLQNISLGDVLEAGLIDDLSLLEIDLSSTPLGAIPLGAIALASTPLGAIPLPGGADWCTLLADISPLANCGTGISPASDSLVDLAIQGVPLGAIPLGAIPLGAIPLGAIPLGAIPLGAISVEGTPLGAIPLGAIPLGAIPLGAIPLGAIPLGAIPLGAISVDGTPLGAIPLGAIPLGAIQLGDLDEASIAASPLGAIPLGAIPLGAIPLGAIPLGAIPLGAIPLGAIPLGAIPLGAISVDGTPLGAIPLGAIPLGAIDLAASPLGAIPLGAIPLGAIPLGAIPLGAIPLGAIPLGAIPLGAIPLGAIPLGAIPLGAIPLGAIPLGAIPLGAIGSIVDCTLIDCASEEFTLADAEDAGAILDTATLADFEGLDTGTRLTDLIGIDGLTEGAIRAQLATLPASADELSEFLTYDNMALADLPAGLAELDATVLDQLGAALSEGTIGALLESLDGVTEAQLRLALANAGLAELADLINTDGMVLGDLPADDPQFLAQTIGDLLPFMENLRIGDLVDLHPGLSDGDANFGTADAEDLSDWGDVTLGELASFNGTSLAQLIASLPADVLAELTLADLLLSLVDALAYDWHEIELGAIDLDSSVGAVEFTSTFDVTSPLPKDRTVRVTATLPLDGTYVEGSSAITASGGAPAPLGVDTPEVSGNQLTWTLTEVLPNVTYELDFSVAPSLTLGSNEVGVDGAIPGTDASASGSSSVSVQQGFEPNDQVGDAGVITAATDNIYVSHIAEAGDIDLFAVDLVAGARLSVSLSNLPADYDLAVFGPPASPIVPLSLRQISPTDEPDIGLDPSANEDGGSVLEDIPLQDLPLVDVSQRRDTESDVIDISGVRTTGRYYIQVSGYSGASSPEPYALFVKNQPPAGPLTCVAQSYQSPGNVGGPLPSNAAMAGVNTLILVNEERLFGKYGAAATTALDAIDDLVTYTNVTNPALGVNAVVVPVEADGGVRAAYASFDAASCDPDTANNVVREIAELVDDLRAADPATEIEHIMIVGDDDVIPMARLADSTTIANESSYATTFIGSEANSLFGAAAGAYFLSDEPYGDVDPIVFGDRALYITDTALGRMVETPDEIAGQVATFVGFEGLVDPSTAFVSGYDFLDDGAQAIVDELSGLPDTDSVDVLINETWTDDDLIDGLFPSGADSPNIGAVNAHFDHYRGLPADQNAAGVESDLFSTGDVDDPARAGDLEGSLLFSMGCHSGLSVPDELFPGADQRALDWAQAYARQGAIWVGNTGYGYGETEGVELSERLMALFAGRLDGSVSVGEALFYAKQTYIGTQQAEYGAYDEKVLQQATFYGIPFFQMGVATTPPPAPLPPQPITFPTVSPNIDFSTIVSDPAFTPIVTPEGTQYEADLPVLDPGTTGEQSTPFTQIEPTISYEVTDIDPVTGEPASIAQDALITGLVTTDVPGIDPDLARPIVDDSNVEAEPSITEVFSDPGLYVSTYLSPEGQRQEVTVLAGTFQTTQPDGIGTQRLFEEVAIEVLYRDPANDADQVEPTFVVVDSQIVSSGGTNVLIIDARVTDNIAGNVDRVFALVAQDPGTNTEWTPVELVNTGGDDWSGSIVLTGNEVEFLLQAADGSGNVAMTTNKGRLFVDDTVADPQPPTEINVSVSRPPDFGGLYGSAVTVTADAGGADIDYQVDGGDIIDGGTAASVVLDPAVIGDGSHVVTFFAGDSTLSEFVVFDTTSPVATITSPANGSVLDLDSDVSAVFQCADAASGVASCNATLNGSPIDFGDPVTDTVGSFTLAVSASDSLGNSASTSVNFTVVDPGPQVDPIVITDVTSSGAALPGETVTVTANYTGGANVVGIIDWGDGTTCTTPSADCTITASTLTGTHSYAAPGTYTVTVTVAGDGPDAAVATVVVGGCTITGTPGNDVLTGTSGDDVICGLGGDDVLLGGSGNDILLGGEGNDQLRGASGDDRLIGGDGSDGILGSGGDDYIDGGDGWDLINGGLGDDEIFAGDGVNIVWGFDGNDVITGGSNTDYIDGGLGNDTISGNGGVDVIAGFDGDDTIDGGAGNDILWGGDGVDTIDGAAGNDRIEGNDDDDDLSGGSGDDRMFGGDGSDVVDGGAGDDTIDGQSGDDMLSGGDGDDTINGQNGDDMLSGGDGVDLLFGGSGADDLFGDADDDVLYGQRGSDDLDGGSGTDKCRGGPGNDSTTACEI